MSYKNSSIVLFLILCFCYADAQMTKGTITYNRKTDWIGIMAELPYMTQEDIDRDKLTWGKEENKGRNYILQFEGDKSIYTYKEEENEGGWSWKPDAFILQRDLSKNQTDDWVETLGKRYRIKEDIVKYKWKILNELREIEGYICMKAETTDTIKNQIIHAWFTDQIPHNGGPEGYSGLPGLILEIDKNNGNSVTTATKIELENIEDKIKLPKKMKGSDISYVELNEKWAKYIENSIKERRNPFWRIRY